MKLYFRSNIVRRIGNIMDYLIYYQCLLVNCSCARPFIRMPLEDNYQRKIRRKNYDNCFLNDLGFQLLIFMITPVWVDSQLTIVLFDIDMYLAQNWQKIQSHGSIQTGIKRQNNEIRKTKMAAVVLYLWPLHPITVLYLDILCLQLKTLRICQSPPPPVPPFIFLHPP